MSQSRVMHIEGSEVLEEQLHKVHDRDWSNLLSSQRRQKKDYDLKVLERAYNVGDLVYLDKFQY